MGTIKHTKTSVIPAPLDNSRISGPDWNQPHEFDLGIADIDGLTEALIPVEQVIAYRDQALAAAVSAGESKIAAEEFAGDAAASAEEAAAEVGTLAAPGGAALVGSTGGITVQAALDAKVKTVDLAAAGGAAGVGTQQAGVGAILRDVQDALSDQTSANAYATIQQAVDAAGATGSVVIPANSTDTATAVSNPHNIAIIDLRHQQLGIHSVVGPMYPVAGYPYGHDLVLRSRASADTYIEHFHVTATTTASLAVGWNYNVPISAVVCGNNRFPGAGGTGGAELFSPIAQIVLGRETANEEQVNSPNWLFVDATHIDILCTKTHAGTTDIDQGGSTLLASHDLYIVSNQVKPAQNTTYDAPLRVKDLGGRLIAKIPSNIDNAMPYGAWQWGCFQMGMFGANLDMRYQHALTTSKVYWRSAGGVDVATLDNSGHMTLSTGIASGNGQMPVAGTGAEVQVGRTATAITSTVDAFVAWQDNAAPLNPSGAAGSLLVAARNIAGAEVVLATQNTVRARISSLGARILGALSTGVNLIVGTNNGELQLGRSAPATAITSTTDAFVAWQDGTDPLNPSLTSGALLLAARNTANAAVNVATQNTVRASFNASGLKVINGFGCNGQAAQAAVAVNTAATDAATTQALVNQLRAALIANGICV